MTKELILIERGIETDRVRHLISLAGADEPDSLVLCEDPAALAHLSDVRCAVRSVDDYVPLSGILDGQLFELASRLTSAWIDRTRTLDDASAHEFRGLSLWEMGRLSQVYIIFRALRRIEAISAALAVTPRASVHVLRNENTFWSALEWVIQESRFSGEVKLIEGERPDGRRNLKGRLFDLASAGWGSAFLLDFRNGMRSLRPLLAKRIDAQRRLHLCLVNGDGHYFQTTLPVIERLRPSADLLVLNTGGDSCAEPLRRRRIPLSYCSQYLPLRSLPGVARRTRRLRELWTSIEGDEDFAELLVHRGRTLWPALRNELQRYCLHTFPRMMVWIEAMNSVLQSLAPSTVVTVPDRHYPARIALALAQRCGVPSLTIQPALINAGPHYGPMYADKAAVIDEYSRRVYITRGGIGPGRLVVTGLPRWDGIPAVLAAARGTAAQLEVREKLALDPQSKLVTFATENLAFALTRRMILAVARAVSKHPDLRLVIKLHPAEPLEPYLTLIGERGFPKCGALAVKDTDLHALLAASELIVAWFSNVVLEAALLDRPVLVANLSSEPDPLPFVQEGIALGAYSEAEIEVRFEELVGGGAGADRLSVSRHGYLERNPQMLDGRATDRIVALLEEMIMSRRMGMADQEVLRDASR